MSTCPTCGGEFASERGVKIHHKVAHGESLKPAVECEVCGESFRVEPHRVDEARYCSYECSGAGKKKSETEITCEVCGDIFVVPPSRADSARYCSAECQATAFEEYTGEDAPTWEGGDVTKTCDYCGEEYDIRPAKVSTSRFCSMDCKGAAYSEERGGEGNPRWAGGNVELTCEWCDEPYAVKPAEVEKSRFCSAECQSEFQATITGQDHPQWRGGRSLYYAVRSLVDDIRWADQREQLMDDECELCGSDENLHGHHIIPLMAGGTNGGWNIMTLCGRCHKTVEEYSMSFVTRHLAPSEVIGRE